MCALSETSSWLCLELGAVLCCPDSRAPRPAPPTSSALRGRAGRGSFALQYRLYSATPPIIHTNFITE